MYGVHLAYQWIRPGDRVLDIGGSAQPFRRANVVLDLCPYEKRQRQNSFFQKIPENFTRETWLIQDVSDYRKPFPFKDQEFDFVVCGHLLEDVKDPIFVASEIMRVAKRGYIEVPTRFHEQLYGVEERGICGNAHHRWFVDLRKNPRTGENEVIVVFKNHLVHSDQKYQIRKPWYRRGKPRLNERWDAMGLFFNGPFAIREDTDQAIQNCRSFLLETVEKARLLGDRLWDLTEGFPVRVRDCGDLKGVFSLEELESRVEKRLPLYLPSGGLNPALLAFEESLLQLQ